MKKLLKALFAAAVLSLSACSDGGNAAEYQNGYGTGAAAEDSGEYTGENTSYVSKEEYNAEDNSFNGKKIIYTGSAELETKEYDKAVSEIRNLIGKYEISMISSNESNDDKYWYTTSSRRSSAAGRTITLELRVPIQSFDDFVNDLDSTSAHVNSKSVSSSDATKRYSDNETKISSLEIQQERLLDLLSKAENVTEMLEIEDRLQEVRYELEILNNSNNQIDYDVQFSRFTVVIREVSKYASDEYSFAERFSDSFGESIANFTAFIQDAVIWFIFVLPFLILAAAVLFVINFIRKKQGKDHVRLKNIFKLTQGEKFSLWTILKYTAVFCLILLILILIFQMA